MLIDLILVEDNPLLLKALRTGLEETGAIRVVFSGVSGEAAMDYLESAGEFPRPTAVLMDVYLGQRWNGIETAVAMRRVFPRFPVVFYSIQDDDAYFRAFRKAGILSHYAYVRKTNYLLPEMILPLIRDAVSGRSFIDPEVESRVLEVQQKDEQNPMDLLEPHERQAALMLARGLTNEQIARHMGYKDKRTVSRLNGQIYTLWNLRTAAADEKTARTRAALIVRTGRLIVWDEQGEAFAAGPDGDLQPFAWEDDRGRPSEEGMTE